jgi:hypothetical protein
MRVTASAFAFGAVVHCQQIERLSYRMRLLRIERILEAAFEAAERVLRLRVFLADHILRQLVIHDERHTRSLSRGLAA